MAELGIVDKLGPGGQVPVIDYLVKGSFEFRGPRHQTAGISCLTGQGMGLVFGKEAEAEALIEQLDADVAAAEALVARATSSPRVLFVLQPPEAPMLVSGEISAAGSMISLAGGSHVFPGFPGYLPMTPEGIVEGLAGDLLGQLIQRAHPG